MYDEMTIGAYFLAGGAALKELSGRKRRWKRLIIAIAFFFLAFFVFFQPLVHVEGAGKRADCQRKDIQKVAAQQKLEDMDYQLLFEQTGLTKEAVDAIREKKTYQIKEFLRFQKAYLGEWESECCSTSLFTKEDRLRRKHWKSVPLAPLEDGDIILSFSSHSLGWRHGHAGLVIDAEKMLTLEAVMPGEDSEIKDLAHWQTYSNFLVLRLKGVPERERKAIAEYAEQNLVHIPYSLTSGVFGKRSGAEEKLRSAQCAYLIWYAFYHFGYDLDSDGGHLVTVLDLARSSKLELIQIFGLTPETWKE